MKFKSIVFIWLALVVCGLRSQNVCNPNGNLIIYTNYDGGTLNINVDQNIPNLVIGVVGYEATAINLSGAFVANVTAVRYAGFNGTNNPCGGVLATSINGAPMAALTTTVFAPASTLANSNGYSMIICGYSCSNSTNQGGCNTVDQIEAYFLNYFSGSSLFAHKVQYNCWSGTYSVSVGGSCCPANSLLQGSIAGNQTVCSSATIAPLTSSVPASGGTGVISYQWQSSTTSSSSGFSNISGAMSAGYNPGSLSTTTYFRRGASTSVNPIIYSNVITVTVNPAASPAVVITPLQVCEGATVNMIVSSPGAVSYTWAGPASFTSAVQSPTLIAQLNSAGVYSVVVANAFSCTATGLSTPMMIIPRPVVSVSVSPGFAVCYPANISLFSNATAATSYSWAGPNSFVAATANTVLFSAPPSSSGIYTVTATNNNCVGTNTVSILIQPSPTLTAIGATVCTGQSAALTATGAAAYLWTGPAGFTATTAIIFIPGANNLNSQIYVVTGNLGSCSASVVVGLMVDPCAGIEKHESRSAVTVFPNPNTGSFMIASDLSMQLLLINALGQTVKTIELPGKKNLGLSFTDVPEGVYYLVSPDGSFNQKVVIAR
ncbi:MAG: T9SS type A sorting domain-containing protein [Bacteroidota bacterium]